MIEESKLKYEGTKGVPHMDTPGNSVKVRTGDWRVFKPVWDPQVCKGCLICVEVCPQKAITSVRDLHE